MLVLCLASGFVSLQSQQKETPYWKLEVPTPVEDGVLTERQKEHSKLYHWNDEDRKIRDAVLKDGGLERFRISCGAFLDLPDLITELAEKADAIVIVSFVSKSSQITSDGTDIFTDYDLNTEQILKDANPGALKRDEIITVTRPGGKVLLYGRIAWIFNTAYESLMRGGIIFYSSAISPPPVHTRRSITQAASISPRHACERSAVLHSDHTQPIRENSSQV
jgi:hypothetical protein